MADISIKNLNEVYLQIECSDSVSYELRDAFTFFVPGYQFTPQFRAKLWDGKIRLYDVRKRLIYRGLIQQIISFAQDRNYTISYDDFDNEFSINEANEFIKSLNLKIEPRDYQVDAVKVSGLEVPLLRRLISRNTWLDMLEDYRDEENLAKHFGLSPRELEDFKKKWIS